LFCMAFLPLSQAAFNQTIVPKGSEQKIINNKVINTESIASKPIDKVLVLKSVRQLQLISGGEALKTYRISLGKNPKCTKLQEGDQRTPEGFYCLDWRKHSNNYDLSMHISYPNISDSARARSAGVKPGSVGMIHSPALDEESPERHVPPVDWHNGRIPR
ncbi:hypothetical protein EWW49_30535, partial [Pseudomonas syringae]